MTASVWLWRLTYWYTFAFLHKIPGISCPETIINFTVFKNENANRIHGMIKHKFTWPGGANDDNDWNEKDQQPKSDETTTTDWEQTIKNRYKKSVVLNGVFKNRRSKSHQKKFHRLALPTIVVFCVHRDLSLTEIVRTCHKCRRQNQRLLKWKVPTRKKRIFGGSILNCGVTLWKFITKPTLWHWH